MLKSQQLSRQEEKVLSLARQGLGDKQIAVQLGLSADTVRTYWQRIRQKVGAATRAEIVSTIGEKQTAVALEAVESEKNILLQEILRRKSVERALRASEQEWRLLADSMPQMVFVARPDGQIFHYNARFYEYTGLSQEEALAAGWEAVIHPEDLPIVQEVIAKNLSENHSFECELRIKRHDGEYRWHINKAVPHLDEKGNAVRYYGTSTDIHESRILRDRLQDSTTFLSQAQEVARLGSYEYDVRTNMSRWSATLFEIYGLPVLEGWFESDDFVKRIHPDDLPHFGQAIRETIDRRASFNERYRYIRPDGQIIHVLTVAKPVVEDDRVVRLVGTVQDFTDQMTTEKRLRDSEYMLREAEEIAGLGSYYWSVDEDQSIWSSTMYKVFERKPSLGVLDAEQFYAILHPDDRKTYDDAMARTMATGQPFNLVYRIVLGDRIKWIHALGSVEYHKNKVARLIGTCQDVTEQRRINLALERKNEQLRYAEALAEYGSYVYDIPNDSYEWSENLYAIHDHDPRKGPMFPTEFRDRLRAEDRPLYDQIRRKLYEDFEPVDQTFSFLTSKGEWKILHTRATPITEDGKLIRVLGTVQDITP